MYAWLKIHPSFVYTSSPLYKLNENEKKMYMSPFPSRYHLKSKEKKGVSYHMPAINNLVYQRRKDSYEIVNMSNKYTTMSNNQKKKKNIILSLFNPINPIAPSHATYIVKKQACTTNPPRSNIRRPNNPLLINRNRNPTTPPPLNQNILVSASPDLEWCIGRVGPYRFRSGGMKMRH